MTSTDLAKTEEFEELRPLLFSIAYRILGQVTEAEDVVQEAWLRYDATSTEPRSAKAFLSAVVTRLAIDVLRSARHRREEYVGDWLPEPLLDDPYEDPARSAELADSLSTAALVLLERLSPLERAIFVLRDVFGFEFAEIATAVGRTEPACRQLAVRARRHMGDGRPRFEADRRQRQELADRFFGALRQGNVDGLRELLSADVQVVTDGGGKVSHWRTIVGPDNVSRLLSAIVGPCLEVGGTVEVEEMNGQPGAIFRDGEGRVVNTVVLDVLDGQVQSINVVVNPDKLAHLGPVADTEAFFRETLRALQARRRADGTRGGRGAKG